MPTPYAVEPVTTGMVDRAFPLMSAVASGLTLGAWRAFCQGVVAAGSRNSPESERVVLAVNGLGYIKGLCIHCVRDHWMYGRLLDVPVFIAASAADAEGVAGDLLQYLQSVCHRSVCSGIRFWTMGHEAWSRRHNQEDVRGADHGLFMPAAATLAEIEGALSGRMLSVPAIIDRLSR